MLSKAHDQAKALRVPVFAPGTSGQEKAAALEDYMLLSAYYHGELHEERLNARMALKPLEDQWRDLQGWETFRRGRTDSSIDEAKAQLRPDLREQLEDLRWTIARLSEQIDRLDRDATKASRAYTMLTGGT